MLMDNILLEAGLIQQLVHPAITHNRKHYITTFTVQIIIQMEYRPQQDHTQPLAMYLEALIMNMVIQFKGSDDNFKWHHIIIISWMNDIAVNVLQ